MDESNNQIKENKKFEIEELKPTPEEQAQKAVSSVFRDESVQISSEFIVMTKNRLDLISQCYKNVDRLHTSIFNDESFALMTLKEKLFALSVELKAIQALTVSLPEHQNTLKQINIQINQLLSNENDFNKIPASSREKVRAAIEKILVEANKVSTIKDSDIILEDKK